MVVVVVGIEEEAEPAPTTVPAGEGTGGTDPPLLEPRGRVDFEPVRLVIEPPLPPVEGIEGIFPLPLPLPLR